jgi:two-component system, chemotaxis family, response regulator Rcp1
MSQRGTHPFEILLVEDNPGDARLVQEALRGSPAQLVIVGSGEEALSVLAAHGAPDLVLLDLNLPGMDGFRVLEYFKSRLSLRVIPVVIFSSSAAEADIQRAYRGFANCYIKKPDTFDDFMKIVQSTVMYWTEVAQQCQHEPEPAPSV